MLFLKNFQWHELVGDRALIPKSCLLASHLKVTGSLCHPLNIEQVYGCILICEVFQQSWNIHFMIILSWYWQTVRAKASGSTSFFDKIPRDRTVGEFIPDFESSSECNEYFYLVWENTNHPLNFDTWKGTNELKNAC